MRMLDRIYARQRELSWRGVADLTEASAWGISALIVIAALVLSAM